jgi:hypothetical protein
MKSIKREFKDRIEYRDEKGNLHREDGPAIERNDGSKYWYLNGKKHREDGPAVEYSNNIATSYYLNEKCYSKLDWEQEVIKLKLKRILDL